MEFQKLFLLHGEIIYLKLPSKILSFFACGYFCMPFPAFGQGPCPSSNCTSGDIRITKVELIKADGTALPNFCTPGADLQIKLRVTFDVTSKHAMGFW